MGRRGMCSTFRTFTKRSSRCDLCVSARSGRGYNFKRLIAKKSPTGGVLILSICVAKILADSDQKCRKCPPILLPQKEKRSPPPNETPVSNVPFKPPHQSNFHWRHRLCCHIWGRQKKPMRHLDQHAKRDVEVAHWGRRFLLSNNYKNNVSEACDFVGCPICAPVDGGNFDFFTCATFFFFFTAIGLENLDICCEFWRKKRLAACWLGRFNSRFTKELRLIPVGELPSPNSVFFRCVSKTSQNGWLRVWGISSVPLWEGMKIAFDRSISRNLFKGLLRCRSREEGFIVSGENSFGISWPRCRTWIANVKSFNRVSTLNGSFF